MNAEEIIKILDEIAEVYEKLSAEVGARTDLRAMWEGRANGIRQAIALIKAHHGGKPNDPLTLEELREMDGEPVWYTKWNVYGLVDIELGLVITKIGDVPLNHAGATGSLYRRKPEEGT